MPRAAQGARSKKAASRPKRAKGERAGISVAMLIASIRRNGGLVSLIAEDLGSSSQNIEQRIKRSVELQAVVAETERHILDKAESKVAKAIDNEDMPTVRWFLDRKGRKRGYGGAVTSVSIEGGSSDSPTSVLVEIRAADADL